MKQAEKYKAKSKTRDNGMRTAFRKWFSQQNKYCINGELDELDLYCAFLHGYCYSEIEIYSPSFSSNCKTTVMEECFCSGDIEVSAWRRGYNTSKDNCRKENKK